MALLKKNLTPQGTIEDFTINGIMVECRVNKDGRMCSSLRNFPISYHYRTNTADINAHRRWAKRVVKIMRQQYEQSTGVENHAKTNPH